MVQDKAILRHGKGDSPRSPCAAAIGYIVAIDNRFAGVKVIACFDVTDIGATEGFSSEGFTL